MSRTLLVLVLVLLWRSAFAQQPPSTPPPATPTPAQPAAGTQTTTPAALAAPASPAAPSVTDSTRSDRQEALNGQKDHHYIGHVELDRPGSGGTPGTTIYADDAWFYSDENKFVATGNVVFAQGNNRISAERAEFNTETHLGTFFNASGIATVQPQRQPPRPGGAVLPPVVGQETVVYFFGDRVEKIGPKKYKITNGGFTTCVQPTPRWDLHADSVILNVDHYTFLKQAVLTVKGVPMLYVPLLIYPTKRGDRATGILIPTYGSSSLRGQSLHNAFFWAVDRSQDATFTHDWFSKVGQGVGTEYRYNYGLATDGILRAYMLDQHETTYTVNGTETFVPGSRSYELRGSANQLLPGNMRARGNVDYFSSIQTSQTFNTNVFDSSRNQRAFGANVIGAWGTYTMTATVDHNEYFYNLSDSVLTGTFPRINFSRNERPLLGSDVYVSLGSEYVTLLRDSRSTDPTTKVVTDIDTGLSRFDVSPQIRYPFKKWQWFTVNSTLAWRDTYYTRSYQPTGDPLVTPSKLIDEGLTRRFFTLQSQILGPVFNRIWDTPDNGYAEKFKHSIEPYLTIQRTSSVDNFAEIVQTDGIDSFIGGTQYTYGVNNRFYAKRKLTPGAPGQAREIVDVELSQSYYSDQRAAQYDRQYQTTNVGGGSPSHFSPVALSVRALPTNDITATMRAEFDSRYHSLRTISASGTYSWIGGVQASVGWTKTGFIPELPGFNDPKLVSQFLNASTNVHTRDNHFGGLYQFNFDVEHTSLLQQRITGFYNAQCCGIAFEYQTYNYGAGSASPIPADHRFFLSFTLAGLGNFSPFNGALSGVPR